MKKNWFKLLSGLAILPIVTTIPLVVTSCSNKNDKNIEQPGESIIPNGGNDGQTGGGQQGGSDGETDGGQPDGNDGQSGGNDGESSGGQPDGNGGQAGGGQSGGNDGESGSGQPDGNGGQSGVIITPNIDKKPPVYKPSPEANKLVSKDSFDKIYESSNKKTELENEMINLENDWYSKKYEKYGFSSSKIELNGNILSYEGNKLIIPKLPLKHSEDDVPLPSCINYQDVKSYEGNKKYIFKIDLINKTYDLLYEYIANINGKEYKNLVFPESNILHQELKLPINVCLTFIETYGIEWVIELENNRFQINIANLPQEQANKIYDIICHLIKIIPPVIDTSKVIWCELSMVGITLGEKNNNDTFNFSYTVTMQNNEYPNSIFYCFHKNNINNWGLTYKVLNGFNQMDEATISGITNQQMTNFFKEILTNSKIMDVNQIKK